MLAAETGATTKDLMRRMGHDRAGRVDLPARVDAS
jgi:hypothetical protein